MVIETALVIKFIGLFAILLGIIKYNSYSINKSNQKLIDHIIDRDEKRDEVHIKNNELLVDINTNIKKGNERIVIDNDNASSITKTWCWNDFGHDWKNLMVNIYNQNHLVEKDNCIKKIQSSTFNILKNTFDKSSVVPGFDNYQPKIEDVLEIINKENIYERVYKLFLETQKNYDELYLRNELFSLYTYIYSILDRGI